MKSVYLSNLFMVSALMAGVVVGNANAVASHVYSNAVSVRSIAVIQHSILTNAVGSFEGVMGAALGSRKSLQDMVSNVGTDKGVDSAKYGTMPMYGEYNDDGSASHGRSGGDVGGPAEFNSLWANWQHFDDRVKYSNLDKMDSDYDVVSVGLAGMHAQTGRGISQWGLLGGYAGGVHKNNSLKINQGGGYIGLYYGYSIDNLNVAAVANSGAMHNDAEFGLNTDGYSNSWAGAMGHISYNIAVDDALTLQPGLYAGYTWVKSDNMMFDGLSVSNTNLSVFELTPGMRAIRHIGSGWYGSANVRYVATWESGGDVSVMGTDVPGLDLSNYVEYGIGIEKSVDRFNVALHAGRRDGRRAGWTYATSLKYIF